MALLRVRLSVAAPAVDGTSSAARTHRSRERRAIEGYEQGRQPRVSVKLGGQAAQVPPWPLSLPAAILDSSDGYGRQAREARAAEVLGREDAQAPAAAVPHGPGAGRRRRDRRRVRDRRP